MNAEDESMRANLIFLAGEILKKYQARIIFFAAFLILTAAYLLI
jgi:hypothetical protein